MTASSQKEIPFALGHPTQAKTAVGYGYAILHESKPLVLAVCQTMKNMSSNSAYFWAPLQPNNQSNKNESKGLSVHVCERGNSQCETNRFPKMYPSEELETVLENCGDWYTLEELQEFKAARIDRVMAQEQEIQKNIADLVNVEFSTPPIQCVFAQSNRDRIANNTNYKYHVETFCNPFALIDKMQARFHQHCGPDFKKVGYTETENEKLNREKWDEVPVFDPKIMSLASFASTLDFSNPHGQEFCTSMGYRIGLFSFSPYAFLENNSSCIANNNVHTCTLESIMDLDSWTGYFKNPGAYQKTPFLADPLSSKLENFSSFEEMRDYLKSESICNFSIIHLQNGILHSDTQNNKQLPALLCLTCGTNGWNDDIIGPDDYVIHKCKYFNHGQFSRTDVDENGHHLPAVIYINDNFACRNMIEWYVDGVRHNLSPQRPSAIGYNWGWCYGTQICQVNVEYEEYRQNNDFHCPIKKDGTFGFSCFSWDDDQGMVWLFWEKDSTSSSDPYEFYNEEQQGSYMIHPDKRPPPKMNMYVQYKTDPSVPVLDRDADQVSPYKRPVFPSDESFIRVPFLRTPDDSKELFSVLENISESEAIEFSEEHKKEWSQDRFDDNASDWKDLQGKSDSF